MQPASAVLSHWEGRSGWACSAGVAAPSSSSSWLTVATASGSKSAAAPALKGMHTCVCQHDVTPGRRPHTDITSAEIAHGSEHPHGCRSAHDEAYARVQGSGTQLWLT